MYGLRPVSIPTTLDSFSPYVIDVVDGQAKLFFGGNEICQVSFPKPLKYYARKFPDGTTYHKIIAYGYLVTVFRNCQCWDPDDELAFYSEYASALKWGGRRRFVNLQTNAQDKETTKRYRAAGVDCHQSNMEVGDKRLFEWINPGKNRRVGWEGWLEA